MGIRVKSNKRKGEDFERQLKVLHCFVHSPGKRKTKSLQGPVSQTSRELFRPGKQFVKLSCFHFEELILEQFFNTRENKAVAIALKRFTFEDTKRYPKCAHKVSGSLRNNPMVTKRLEHIFEINWHMRRG